MSTPDFNEFTRQSLDEGFDEVLVREWAPDAVVGDHTHPFSVEAVVTYARSATVTAYGSATPVTVAVTVSPAFRKLF